MRGLFEDARRSSKVIDMVYTKLDIGKEIDALSDENGMTLNVKIVHVFCQVCGEEFIGTRRAAGGFLGGHECYHAWEFAQAMIQAEA